MIEALLFLHFECKFLVFETRVLMNYSECSVMFFKSMYLGHTTNPGRGQVQIYARNKLIVCHNPYGQGSPHVTCFARRNKQQFQQPIGYIALLIWREYILIEVVSSFTLKSVCFAAAPQLLHPFGSRRGTPNCSSRRSTYHVTNQLGAAVNFNELFA